MSNGHPPVISNDVTGFITFYNLICAERGFVMPPHLVPFAHAIIDTRIQNLLIIVGPGSGKSTLLSEVYPAFAIGQDPTITILGVSAGEALMQGFQRSVMETIEWSPVYRALFPTVKPDKSAGWSSERGMFVTGRELGNPDPNFAPAGLDSKSLTGKHGRLIICDDIHDKENSGSEEQCDKVWATWHNTIIGRADPRGARYIVAGRRWSTADIYKRLMATGEWVALELPAERDGTKNLWVDVTVPDGLVCCFTDPEGPFAGNEPVSEKLDRSKMFLTPRRRLRLDEPPPPRRPRLRLDDART